VNSLVLRREIPALVVVYEVQYPAETRRLLSRGDDALGQEGPVQPLGAQIRLNQLLLPLEKGVEGDNPEADVGSPVVCHQ